jgi:hypothetical protein
MHSWPHSQVVPSFFGKQPFFWAFIWCRRFTVLSKQIVPSCLFNIIFKGGHRQIAPGTPFWKEALVFWLPNSFWVFLPLMAICCLWKKVHDGWIRKDALEKHAEQEIEAIL